MKKTEVVEIDPTVETTDVVIGEKVYRMCLNVRALAVAERELKRLGYNVVLIVALSRERLLELDSILVLFAASIRKFHPEVGFEEAIDLVTLPYLYTVAVAVHNAWEKALPKPEGDKANPTEAGGEQAAPVAEEDIKAS
jgi:hypothetical protein